MGVSDLNYRCGPIPDRTPNTKSPRLDKMKNAPQKVSYLAWTLDDDLLT